MKVSFGTALPENTEKSIVSLIKKVAFIFLIVTIHMFLTHILETSKVIIMFFMVYFKNSAMKCDHHAKR